MKKIHVLLSLVLILTFAGGFYSGIMYSAKSSEQTLHIDNPKGTHKAPFEETKEYDTKVQSKVLIGYVQDFRDPETINYSDMTHVIFSFAHPLPDGRLSLNGIHALNNLKKMVSLAHQHNTKVMLAIGGWFHIWGGESYPYFKEAIMNPDSRTKLIQELINITERENLDGIDIDFEYPRSMEEAQSLAAFTKELSSGLHNQSKELSIAVYAKVHSSSGTEVKSVFYDHSMFANVDHVNIMAYDGHWDGGYNAANLSPYSYAENIVNYWSELFSAYQLDKDKLVLGIPIYAQPEKQEQKQISYKSIIDNNPANAENDSVQINGMTYYYNGESTVEKKTLLALDHGFGGMMLWEAGHDALGEHSITRTIAEVLEAKYVLK